MRFPAEVERIFEIFRDNGFAAYAVGGCVRDFLLQKKPTDYDIATDALPEEVMEMFGGFKIIPTGLKHGTVTVLSGKLPVEITTFRTEGLYLDNRRPSEVYFSKNIADDLKRRDFTINAIAYCPSEGYLDIFGGKKDLENRVIRSVGEAGRRFGEDALRLLRALRLAAELGFDIEEKTASCIHQKRELLENISAERINTEFSRLLMSARAGDIMRKYRDVIEVFLPEMKEDPAYITKIGMLDYRGSLSVKLAVLLNGMETGARLGKTFDTLSRIKYDRRTMGEVTRLLWYQNKKIVPGKKQVMVWMNTVGKDFFFKLLELKSIKENMQAHNKIAQDILYRRECYSLNGLSVKGADLIDQGILESKELGKILQTLLFGVILEKFPNEKDVLLKQANNLYSILKSAGV